MTRLLIIAIPLAKFNRFKAFGKYRTAYTNCTLKIGLVNPIMPEFGFDSLNTSN